LDHSQITAVHPRRAVEGGRIAIHGADFPIDRALLPEVRVGDLPARVVFASRTRIDVLVPEGAGRIGAVSVRVEGASSEAAFFEAAGPLATGVHQVDNPVIDHDGNLYVTFSGARGQQVPVSIFRVRPDGARQTFATGIVNPTSMALGPDGQLYVSSRFEGAVYRIGADGTPKAFATELGVACGLAFGEDGALFVGDRSGTVFKVGRTGHTEAFATLPPSVAAFHLAFAPDGDLYVTGPTLGTYDTIYRIAPDGVVGTVPAVFGRPQGIAFDRTGALLVVEALAGQSGLYRMPAGGADRELLVAAPALIGVAVDQRGGLVVCSSESVFRFGYQAS
jgi:sugar lactone lactonase YvrE